MDLVVMARELLQIKEMIHMVSQHEYGEFYYDIEIFEQIWGNTSCAFESIGGSAMTKQTTYVLIPKEPNRNNRPKAYLVFFGGSFGYKVKVGNKAFEDDLKNKNLAGIKTGKNKYKDN
jgi:hypothetical protein